MTRRSDPTQPTALTRRAWLKAVALAGGAAAVKGCANSTRHAPFLSRAGQTDPEVRWVWVGGVTDRWATVVAAFTDDEPVSIEVMDPTGATVLTTAPVMPDPFGVARFHLNGLKANTRYTYRFIDEEGELPGGAFSTFPAPKAPASFRVALASCNKLSNNPVFHAIARQDPLLFMQNGDLFYGDIASNDPDDFRRHYETVLGDPAQAALLERCPVTYMWDDHDFGPNNSNHSNPSRAAAHRVYRERVPHYPLLLRAESRTRAAPLLQAFTIGRVRFILTDLRSEHSREHSALMGRPQRERFLQELEEAAASHALVVWMSSVPWNGRNCSDAWACAPNERRIIANFVRDRQIPLCILSGDAHMVAIDDGRNADYADGGGAPIPIFQAAALGQHGSYKGGPYSHGASPGGGQFGLMDVSDDGDSLIVRWSARHGADGLGDEVVQATVDAEGPIEASFRVRDRRLEWL